MTHLTRVALAGVLAIGLGTVAQAQTVSPSPIVPKLGNSQPGNPVATNGTPLPFNNAAQGVTLLSGRSAYVTPVDGVIGTGAGIAGDAVGTGFNAVGGIVNGTVNTVGSIVR